MTWGLHFTAACGLATFLALCAPASANTFTYNLAGDTTTAYSVPPVLGYKWVDLHDATSGSTAFPAFTLQEGDTVQATITLNHPMSFTVLDFFLQEAADNTTTIAFNTTYAFFLGGVAVTDPASFAPVGSTSGGLAFGTAFSGIADTMTMDKVVVNAVITSLTDPSGGDVASLDFKPGQPYVGFYNTIVPTPIPPTLWLMSTALGGLGIFARRKRKAAEAA